MKQLVSSTEILNFASELLDQGQETSFTVTGTSMRPFLKSKETLVTLASVKSIKPKKFDIVMYKVNDCYILHRIVNQKENDYIIMGDALKVKEVVSKDNLIGVVVKYEYKNKIILRDNRWMLFKVKFWYLLRGFRRILLKVFR